MTARVISLDERRDRRDRERLQKADRLVDKFLDDLRRSRPLPVRSNVVQLPPRHDGDGGRAA